MSKVNKEVLFGMTKDHLVFDESINRYFHKDSYKDFQAFNGMDEVGFHRVVGSDDGAGFRSGSLADFIAFEKHHVFCTLKRKLIRNTAAVKAASDDEVICRLSHCLNWVWG